MSENLTSGSSSSENLSSPPRRSPRPSSGENLATKPAPAAPRRPAKVVEQPKPEQPIKVMKKIELKKKKD